MRSKVWITVSAGVFLLSGVASGQSPTNQELNQAFQAPGTHVWIGRAPSKDELKAAILDSRPQAQATTSDEPDFQNDKFKFWIGRVPSAEALRPIAAGQ